MLTISPGYWSPPVTNGTALLANASLAVYKCSSTDCCVGASVTESQLTIPNVCGDGYVGDLCSGCDAGWANTGGGKCVRCHTTIVLICSLIVVPGAVLGALAVLVSVVVHNPRPKSQVTLVRCRG